MLFAIMGFLKEDIQVDAARVAPDVNEFLGQWTHRPRVAGALRDKNGTKVGHLILLEAENVKTAEEYLGRDPYCSNKLYSRTELLEFAVEVGRL